MTIPTPNRNPLRPLRSEAGLLATGLRIAATGARPSAGGNARAGSADAGRAAALPTDAEVEAAFDNMPI
jgi:hypothetical protein